MNIKSKIKLATVFFLLVFIVPQISLASSFPMSILPDSWLQSGITANDPLSKQNESSLLNKLNPMQLLPDSWLKSGLSDTAKSGIVSGSLGGTTNSTGNSTSQTSLKYNQQGVGGLFDLSQGFLGSALKLLISLAVVWFIWNVFHYAVAVDEVDKAVAKDKMVWGIIAIFVMVSVWGLVAILQNTFQIFPSGSGPSVGGIMPTF